MCAMAACMSSSRGEHVKQVIVGWVSELMIMSDGSISDMWAASELQLPLSAYGSS